MQFGKTLIGHASHTQGKSTQIIPDGAVLYHHCKDTGKTQTLDHLICFSWLFNGLRG